MIASSEFTIFEENSCAILSMLNYESARTELQHLSRSARNACLASNELGFGIVDQQNIHALQRLKKIVAMMRIGDPVIHRVTPDQLHAAIHLPANVALEHGVNVGQ